MKIEFLEARYWKAGRGRIPKGIVVHTTETGCLPGVARIIASKFQLQSGAGGIKSAHYVVDPETVIQCVLSEDIAWHAPKANAEWLGIEHAFRAFPFKQKGKIIKPASKWDTKPALAMLGLSAMVAAKECKRWGIPIVRVSPDEIKAGAKGFCGHVDTTKAFNVYSGHQDPGPAFPWDEYLKLVQAEFEKLK